MGMEAREDALIKVLDDVTNYDLAMVCLPDSVGSFLQALIEDKWGLIWDEVKNTMTLEEVVTRYSRMKGKK